MAEEKSDVKKDGKAGDGAKTARAGARGPAFPSVSFPNALDLTRKVYENSHVRAVSDGEVAVAMGYGSVNGTSSSRLAALRRYGLLISQGDGNRVSSEAVTILEMGKNDPEAAAHIKEMALRPAAFKVMYDRFGEKIPQDNVARVFLMQNGFQGESANTLIRVYKETITYVQDAVRSIPATPVSTPRREDPPVDKTAGDYSRKVDASNKTDASPPLQDTGFKIPENAVRFPMSRDSFATIIFNGSVTQEGIEKLRQYLELSLDLYPLASELADNASQTSVDSRFFDEDDAVSDDTEDEAYEDV
jgi:hypothetical protein